MVRMPEVPTPQLIAIGETMVLVAPAAAEPLLDARDFRLEPGGAEANVASHFVRLGGTAAWVGRVGDEMLGRRLVRQLAERGLDVRWVDVDPNAPTGVYFKDPGRGVHYLRRGSAASRMSPATLDGLPIDEAAVVHVSGITAALSESCAALVDAAIERTARSTARFSFDVNYRPALWQPAAAAARLRELAARADVVFVGLDEAQALWGSQTPAEVREMLPEPGILVVKDGDVGATEFSADGETHVPAHRVEVVEVVGAGDAFAAGYLTALLGGADAEGRLDAGHRSAVTVLGTTGDFPA